MSTETPGGLTSLIFPTYNPGRRLERTWDELRQFLAERREPWEVLFVCDGCTDGSDARLAELIAAGPACVRLLRLTPNRGKGYAVRQGLLAAHGDWRLFADVDLAYPFPDILRLAQTLWNGAAVAVGSRTHAESRLVLPPHLVRYACCRHLQSRLFAALARMLLALPQSDPQAGLKGMTAEVAAALLPRLRCDGFGFDCELLAACNWHGLSVAEVPVCVRCDDAHSTTGLRSALRALVELWQVRRRGTGAPHGTRSIIPSLPQRGVPVRSAV